MKKPLAIFSGLLIVMVGLAFVFPAVAQLRDTGALPAMSVGLLLLGLVLTLSGGGTVVYAASRRFGS
jgi:hypothetical protein